MRQETKSGTQDRLAGYSEAYSQLRTQRHGREPLWMQQLREDGWARFTARGFPTTHDEDWRFTNLAPLARIPFRRAEKVEAGFLAKELEAHRLMGAACQLVFVNGHFAPELSDVASLPRGLEWCALKRAVDCGLEACAPGGIEQHLGRYADVRRDVFAALNTALWEDGAYLRIRRGVAIEHPVHLLYITAGSGDEIMTHPRTLVVAEEQSQVAIVEDYVSIGVEAGFSNAVTELVAADGAVVSHFLVERENLASFNVSTLRIEQGRASNVASHSILTGGGLVRNNVHPVLAGEGAECLINGLFVGDGHQHIDNYMLVEHARPQGASRQFYNGILAGHARGVFHGRIVVHKDAQKTDAKQTNRNLLLSDAARIDTKPQLEIHADDVKCTHGATIGQIEEEQVFYLRSRGFPEVEARNLLLYAFAAECLDRMKEPAARAFAERLIEQRLDELALAKDSAAGDAMLEEETQNREEVG
ncbi:MAG: Fe-S cluster assembly protein SufD [Terracidiphilus sp.]